MERAVSGGRNGGGERFRQKGDEILCIDISKATSNTQTIVLNGKVSCLIF